MRARGALEILSRRSLLAGGAAALGAAGVPLACRAADSYTMRFATATAATSAQSVTALELAKAVQRRSGGQLKIEVYPSGQLATQLETIDGLTNGVIDFSIHATTFLSMLFPRFQVLDAPFLFKDVAALYRVLDGQIGQDFAALLETRGIVGLGFGTGGFRELETTSKTVASPEDMRGLRIRTAGGAVDTAAYQALGAIPVPIDLSELFTALTQRTVDGLDVPLAPFLSGKFSTVAKHVALTNHNPTAQAMVGSKRKIEALPRPLQTILREEMVKVVPFWRTVTIKETAAAVQTMKGAGVAFNDIQYPAFRKLMDPVYVTIQTRLGGDLLDRVSRVASGR